jgi:hypothetical protein
MLQHNRGTKMCKTFIKITLPGFKPTTFKPLSYCRFGWKGRPVFGICKERRGFTELLRNCPEYSRNFLNVREIPPLNCLRRIP